MLIKRGIDSSDDANQGSKEQPQSLANVNLATPKVSLLAPTGALVLMMV